MKNLYITLVLTLACTLCYGQEKIHYITLKDGVKCYYIPNRKSSFQKAWEMVSDIYNSTFYDAPPFGKTVAFLTGVSNYNYLKPLPKVETDIIKFTKFLLLKGGVDTVYVAFDRVASPELVSYYMMDRFRTTLSPDDRLIFLYSGHAEDLDGNTGYMQFINAQPGKFASNVLKISDTKEWSRINKIKHILFIIDACTSGLAFEDKGGSYEDKLLTTMSGEGSRTVLTAGTHKQKTPDGLFMSALLNAFEKNYKDKIITTESLYADLRKYVNKYNAQNDRNITPRKIELENYTGTFIFINANKTEATVKHDKINLTAVPKGKGDNLNLPPEATNQKFSTTINNELTFDILAGCSDKNNDKLTLTHIETPKTGGKITILNGVAKYVPSQDFFGEFSVRYFISDGIDKAVGNIIINVKRNSSVLVDRARKLKIDGKLKEDDHVVSRVIEIVPAGSQVEIIGLARTGVYKVRYNDIVGYMNDLYFE
ncbi:cadherin-like domain-containing protein [Pontibacter harenae]|uniref:cadherin-like domain-containing protein n=1 Tax=Pontibacter harenae TaxID=2894083 RepID=UPI001E28473F|nr:Ig-like domain-containing protein [Pontibacter harenae]MCC9168640.1 Ig-like domain-containing protein [Pontibacter harenae]